jgi:hypothetical protein
MNELQCEYGQATRWTCNTVARCVGSVWQVAAPESSCPTTNPAACPATKSDVPQGSPCSPQGTACDYSTPEQTSVCACLAAGGPILSDGGSPQAEWQCSTGPGDDGICPLSRPRLGTSCAEPAIPENQECDYGVCGVPDGLGVECNKDTDTWVEGQGGACFMQ